MCFPHLSWPRASSLKLWLQLFFENFLLSFGLLDFENQFLAGITLFAQKTWKLVVFPKNECDGHIW